VTAPTQTHEDPPSHGAFPPAITLLVVSGPDQGKQVTLQPGIHVVGKEPGCALELSDPAVSRAHLEIELGPDGARVRDLESKNGTFFNGARITELTVGPGAVVRVGATSIKLVGDRGLARLLPSPVDDFGRLVGESLAMRELYALLSRVATSDATVLLHGETGTGKELCAEAVHQHSPRAAAPFVICDLAGASRTLIESELFGHVRGAFTGADRDRVGAFVQANGGTLFIDEIGELELAFQPRLLRALEKRQVKPLGASAYTSVDVRVVVATNRNLAEEVKAGRFREDLYHRLAVLQVDLPPLRVHKEDIAALVAAFVAPRALEIPQTTLGLLCEYDWPGNVRELKNVVARAVALLGEERVLTPEFLGIASDAGAPPGHFEAGVGFHEAKERMITSWERAFLSDLLSRAGGNISEAARRGGIDRPYLYRLLKKHQIRA
jgi:two-component system nitrogen regulation response regulator GlnG